MTLQKLTKTITLPVCGLDADIHEGDAHAERLLYNHPKGMGEGLIDYWANLTSRIGTNEQVTRDHILNLTQPDQHFLGIEIYRLNYGDRLELAGECSACGEPAAYAVPLDELKLIPMPQDGPVFQTTLPRSGSVVTFGYLSGLQEMENASMEGLNLARAEYVAIRTVDGEPIGYEDWAGYPNMDHAAFRQAQAAAFCGYDTEVRFTHKCGRRVVIDLLTDPSFVVPGLVALRRK